MALLNSIIVIFLISQVSCLLPPKFQWKVIDFAWESSKHRDDAISRGKYIQENIMPTGIARWRNKLFVTIPRWKKGVPSSLNYLYLNGTRQSEPLSPYPNWAEGCLNEEGQIPSNRTVVSTFRIHVDKFDRLWVVDNGVSDMSSANVQQISEPAILVFDLKTDNLINKFVLPDDVLRDSSVFTSIVVEIPGKDCHKSYAYITDMGSNAVLVYDMAANEAWRVENHYFHFDPQAGVYNVGGVDFYWNDGVSSATLSPPKKNGYSDLYLHPTSSTKLFRMSTELLRDRNVPKEDIFNGVVVVGDRGPKSQATACDIDPETNVLFYTQVCKNGLGCWNINKPLKEENSPMILSDCDLMEFPNDVKVDHVGNVWMLSDRQAKFLYNAMDFKQVNFRILMAPAAKLIEGTPCAKPSLFEKIGRSFSKN